MALKNILIFTKLYYKHLTAKETISSDQRRVIEQAKYTYSYLKKPLKQTITIEDQGKSI